MKAEDISSITSESGVIASVICNPEMVFYSEELLPNHFSKLENRAVYTAVSMLAQRGVKRVDAYNIITVLESDERTKTYADCLTVDGLQDLIDMSDDLARRTVEEYRITVKNVINAAMRRDLLKQLKRCEAMCLDMNEQELEQRVYKALDDVLVEFSSTNDIPSFSEIVDEMWSQIKSRQADGFAGLPFKFPALNEYATIERGELFIFGAEQKQGKSIMLLNCAVDLLKQGQAVLYLDSELNSRLFTARLISHLTGIEFKRVTSGNYTDEEEQRINLAIQWVKEKPFTHLYIPMFDIQSIYAAVKKVRHTQGLDVLIVDYFKSKGDGDAFDSYQELGRFTDMVKNQICGDMNIAGLGAAQETSSGKLADSAKIARNASTIAYIRSKTPEEIEADGAECGNKKLIVAFNRNGAQMVQGEYIDLQFNGNLISYEEAKQHIPQLAY